MKHLLLSIVLLVLSLRILPAQTLKFANMIQGLSTTYGINDTSVFKVDAAGNSVWVKDFRGYIVTGSNYRNELIGSAFDGKYLYVLEMQGRDYSFPHTYNPAIIKMDTLGNVIFTISSSISPGNSFTPLDIYPSFRNGVWVLSEYAPGFTHYGDSFKVDSLGNVGTFMGYWYGSVATVRKLSLTPDSNYLVCVNHRPSSPTFGDEFTTLTKFNESGSVIWRSDYAVAGAEQMSELEMILDSLGNSYLFCRYSNSPDRGLAGIKVSPSGNVLISKLWPTLLTGNITLTSIRISNNEIVCAIDTNEIRFDTSLSNICIPDQNLTVTTGNSYLASTHQYNFTPESFTPANGAVISFTTSVLPDYCNSLNAESHLLSSNSIIIYPNPAHERFTIQTESNANSMLTISDLHGRRMLKKEFSNQAEIDVSGFSSGIYFVEVSNAHGIALGKIFLY